MKKNIWESTRMPQNGYPLWELFHENSKTNRFGNPPSTESVFHEMQKMHDSLPYYGKPTFNLPGKKLLLKTSLQDAILNRQTCRNMEPVELNLATLESLLYNSYGVSRDMRKEGYPRSFRMVPSGGSLFPLEIYFYSKKIADLPHGLFHYQVQSNKVCLLKEGDFTDIISSSMVQQEIPGNASIILFITAMFQRTTFKYDNRGYRFILLEAGHVAQNINLICSSKKLGVINIGGFYDREIDRFLEIDGVTHSTVYMIAVGKNKG